MFYSSHFVLHPILVNTIAQAANLYLLQSRTFELLILSACTVTVLKKQSATLEHNFERFLSNWTAGSASVAATVFLELRPYISTWSLQYQFQFCIFLELEGHVCTSYLQKQLQGVPNIWQQACSNSIINHDLSQAQATYFQNQVQGPVLLQFQNLEVSLC